MLLEFFNINSSMQFPGVCFSGDELKYVFAGFFSCANYLIKRVLDCCAKHIGKYALRVVLLVVSCALSMNALATNSLPKHPLPVLAVWLWGDNADASASLPQKKRTLLDLVNETSIQRDFFHRIVGEGINRIYLNVNLDAAGNFIFQDHLDALSQFIRRAHLHRIEVFALFGDTAYVAPENHAAIVGERGLLSAILGFNSLYQNGFDGIQSDIEPYYDGSTGEPTDLSIVGPFYLEIMSQIATRISSHRRANQRHFVFEAAIPFWYGMSGDDGSAPKQINYAGTRATMDWHLLRLVDSVAVMAYRDVAEGVNGVIALSEPTLKIAEILNKDVLIALETQKPNPKFGVTANLTVYEEGRNGLNRIMSRINKKFAERTVFRGIALHHYASLLNLQPGREIDETLLDRGVIWSKDAASGVRLWDVSGNYGNYGNHSKNNRINSGEYRASLAIDADVQGGWGAGVSFLISSPETQQFLNASDFNAIEVTWCSNIDAVLQLADARWHDLDDSVPIGDLPKTDGKQHTRLIPLGRPHPVWGITVGEDPRFIYSGSNEYGWIDRSLLASLFLRFSAPQKGNFQLIGMRFVKSNNSSDIQSLELKLCKDEV